MLYLAKVMLAYVCVEKYFSSKDMGEMMKDEGCMFGGQVVVELVET